MQLIRHLLTIVAAVLIACVGAFAVAAIGGSRVANAASPENAPKGCAMLAAPSRYPISDTACRQSPPRGHDGASKQDWGRKHSAATHEASEPSRTQGSPAARATSGGTASKSPRPKAIARR